MADQENEKSKVRSLDQARGAKELQLLDLTNGAVNLYMRASISVLEEDQEQALEADWEELIGKYPTYNGRLKSLKKMTQLAIAARQSGFALENADFFKEEDPLLTKFLADMYLARTFPSTIPAFLRTEKVKMKKEVDRWKKGGRKDRYTVNDGVRAVLEGKLQIPPSDFIFLPARS